MLRRLFLTLSLVMVMSLGFVPVAAAQSDTGMVIQISIPQFYQDLFEDTIIPAFEAANPGITVEVVLSEMFGGLTTSDDIETDLDNAADAFSKADLVLVDSTLTPEFTRSGYVLDLSPLASTDPTLNPDEFYPAALESFRWDNGLWALPVGVDVILAFYQPSAFDAAGLAYPSSSWTADDWANAVRALTEFDTEGKATKLAFDAFEGFGATFLSLVGAPLRDDSTLPSVPNLDTPAAVTVVNALAALYEGGYFEVAGGEGGATVTFGGPGGDNDGAPLSHARSAFSAFSADSETMAADLPGGAVMTAQGFAISAGTRYPEVAYEFAKFLTNSPEAASLFFGTQPARRTVGAPVDNGQGGRAILRFGGGDGELSPEAQAVIDAAFETARPMRDLHFTDRLSQLANSVLNSGLTAETTLQEQELTYLTRLQAADARRATPIVVNTPRSQIELGTGEIALNIGVGTGISPTPNQADWDALAAEFAAQDPQVGAVFVEGTIPFDLSEMNANYDCFVTTNGLSNTPDFSQLRSLDPLLQSDMNFDPNDLLGGVLLGFQKDGQTWAYPLTLSPEALSYNPTLFAQAGVPEPLGSWTVSQFEDALRQITANTGQPAFAPGALNSTYIMILAAAYGGNPIDTRTTPTTLNYDSPETVAAIKQILDLALTGAIDYQPLAGGPGGIFSFGGSDSPLSSTTVSGLGGFSFGGGGRGGVMIMRAVGSDGVEAPEDPTRLVAYPRGTTFNGVSYSTTAGYIGSRTQNMDACYRFLSFLSDHLDIVGGMPAYRSQINNPAVIAQNGESSAQFFADYAAMLEDPNTITVGQLQFGFGESYWFQRAMDSYIESDGTLDLAAELAEAQTFTEEYRVCSADIAPITPGPDSDFGAYIDSLSACATSVDPTADFGF